MATTYKSKSLRTAADCSTNSLTPGEQGMMSSEFWKTTIPTHFTLSSKLFITIKAEKRAFKNQQTEKQCNKRYSEETHGLNAMLHCREAWTTAQVQSKKRSTSYQTLQPMTETDTHCSIGTLIINALCAQLKDIGKQILLKNGIHLLFWSPKANLTIKTNVTLEWKKGWERIPKQMQQ